jgi:nicotinamide-nucleotide amidase
MKAILLSIGDELVLGQTLDTNGPWIAQQLAAVGCEVVGHVTVGDDQTAIEDAIGSASGHRDVPEIVVITGGLGPTEDDLTRQAIAESIGCELVLDETWLRRIEEYFRRLGRAMPERNRIQAMIPAGATMIPNDHGTAAGVHAVYRTPFVSPVGMPAVDPPRDRVLHIFALPGVPKEMKPMFVDRVLPIIREFGGGGGGGGVILQTTLHTFGLGESAIAELLGEQMMRGRNPSVGTTVSNNIVSIRINARAASRDEAERSMNETVEACKARLGDLVFAADDQTLSDAVAAMLAPSHLTVTTAESCTGGLLAKYLTDVSGSSGYFRQGFIVYSNDAKRARLGVSENLINVHGAVSEPVVIAMARNARRLAETDFALAISGVAGPTGGTPAKPVGTVCVALAHLPPAEAGSPRHGDREDEVSVVARTFAFAGDREAIRDRAAKMALTMLRFRLLRQPLPF